ncbi:hypothetical protein DH2020_027406 [Rehmannia glutinosa]|uniref:Uncharacterized protein n=1 Tax=Rehmannia glutinosa TaxID=99300 RepID=A0ABR0VUA8_REHGL
MVLLTLSASIDSLTPPPCTKKPCIPASDGQTVFLYCALALIALGTGGIKPCVSSFGADQFDESDKSEADKKYAFFNWFFFAINMGALLGITLMVYIQVEFGWVWGFGVPTAAMIISVFVLAAGFVKYRGVEVGRGDELYEVRGVESDIFGARKLAHTEQYRFLDKAAVQTGSDHTTTNRWKLCTVTQVEELKSIIRILPIWASTIALAISFSQLSTFFIGQATTMDRNLISLKIPPGSTPVFSAVNALILVPVYEKLVVPFLRAKTGHPRGITSLQRMGIGLFVSILAMLSAALVEKKRRDNFFNPDRTILSVFWLFPQCFLIGMAEVFTYVGQLEFFYDEATDGTRSISSAMFLSEIGIGSWISTAIVKIVEKGSGGVEKGWLRDDLNQSRLDYFYWILTGINGVNFLVYLWVALRYKGRNGRSGSVRDESMVVDLGGDSESEGENGEFRSVVI